MTQVSISHSHELIFIMSTEGPNPRVGVAALIYARDGKFLTGKRMGSHGAGKQPKSLTKYI
jgi:hypothetical protein